MPYHLSGRLQAVQWIHVWRIKNEQEGIKSIPEKQFGRTMQKNLSN
jgi:hypothetical protein